MVSAVPHPRTNRQGSRARDQGHRRRGPVHPHSEGAPRRPRGKALRWLIFACFFAVDLLALLKLALRTDWITVCLGFSVVSFITTAVYKDDKSGARMGAWRTSETLLHFLELAGGWPAAFIAQQRYRHKTVKFSYQFFFWAIGLLHLFFAADYLMGWKVIRTISDAI